jgi:hypothetical protein
MEPITQIRNEYELLIAPDIKFKITSHEDLRKESSFSLDNYIEKWISNDSSEEYKYIDFKKALCNDDTNFKTFTTMESV